VTSDGELSDTDYRALAELRYQLRTFLAFSEGEARGVGLEPRQHQLLLALRALPEEQPATIAALAERLVVKHHTAVELVDRLEERGLLVRKRAEGDRRQVRVRITTQGAVVLRRLTVSHRRELRKAGPALIAALQGALGGTKAAKRRAS
jgi:DNA-binding MarR family transcriptional regulator